jgi:hypothetical protein
LLVESELSGLACHIVANGLPRERYPIYARNDEMGIGEKGCLPALARIPMLSGMYTISEEDAAAIRAAYEQGGELAAAVELRRRFPGLANNENTRICARTIAGWKPQPAAACQITPLRPRGGRRPRTSTP